MRVDNGRVAASIEAGGGFRLAKKLIILPGWDMQTDDEILVAHGLDYTKIVDISVMVRMDSSVYYIDFNSISAFLASTTTSRTRYDITNVGIKRSDNGYFDGGDYNDNSFPRGYLVITYMV